MKSPTTTTADRRLAATPSSARLRGDHYAAWQKLLADGLKIEDLNGLAKVELHEDGWCRGFQRYDSYQRADMMSSHRLGHRQKERIGEAFWTHLAVPGLCFPTRKRALDAAARVLGLNDEMRDRPGSGGPQH